MTRRLIGLCALLVCCAPATFAQTVTGVELRSDVPLARPEEARALIVLRPGDRLSREAIVRSLRNLHASGVADEIEAYVGRGAEGARVVIALRARIQVREVRIAGEPGIKTAELRRVLPQGAAQPLLEDRVIRGVYRLQELYRERGYLESMVRVEVEVEEASKQAVVTYHVQSGPEAHVGVVNFEGDPGPFGPAELQAAIRSAPGARYRQAAAEGDAERLESWLFDRGHRQALVERPRTVYQRESHTMDLIFGVRAGPRFEFEIWGVEAEDLRKRKLPPFGKRERLDEAYALRTVRALRRHYQEKGHYRVEIDWSEERSEEVIKVALDVRPGPTFELRAVGFSGNEAFAEQRLAELMTTAPKRLLGGGSLVDEVLDADLANIRSYYALQGFAGTEVGPAEIAEANGALRVSIPIREGMLRTVVNVGVSGVTSLAPADLLRGLQLAAGGPFHPRRLEETLDGIRARYGQLGYASTQVSSELEWNESRSLVDVSIRVLEGPRSEVDRIILRGNHHTDSQVIRRSLGLDRGDPVGTGRLLEAQRELYALGIFSRIDVSLAPARPFAGERDVVVRVEEGRRNRVIYGLGFDSEDGARGLLGYSYSNLFGRAVSLRLDARASQREQQFRALVRQPLFGRHRLPVSYSLFRIDEEQESFDSERLGVQVEARRAKPNYRLGLLMTYKRVEVESRDPLLAEIEIDRDLRQVEIASITPSVLVDRRDDPVDPRRGWSSSLQLESAFPLFAARTRFFKLFGQQTFYLDLRRLGVVAASLRLGAIEPVGDNVVDGTVPEGLASASTPISERFFAGGRTTHRSYVRDGLGIVGESLLLAAAPGVPQRLVPLGGNGLALLNVDYRFPIAGPVGGTVFVDAGNVWADWRRLDPAEAKLGAGVGVRYLSPIGPVRIDIGWKLDREPSEDSFVVHFSFGNPF